ncbi:MAG: ATP-binding cassette domain-containing protein, partial [Phycisphaerales bacterium]|nr:ATP-binding cassette domain-containing protein [Phycisphaerales bacterium]
MPILSASNITLQYGDDLILDGVSLSLEQGERIGIVGRNGCGKSSL